MALICAIGMARVFIFCAAFPFFNNVDESAHFDLVVKYSRGHIPRSGSDSFSVEAGELFALYESPEFLKKAESLESSGRRPVWTYPEHKVTRYVQEEAANWQQRKNHEAFSPPVYYAAAGLWYGAGKLIGLQGGELLYWVRFLNVPLFGALLLLSYIVCGAVFPGRSLYRLGVPMQLVFFPQDLFYSINSDVLSPLGLLLSSYMLYRITSTSKGMLFHAATGLVLGLTFLVKLTNVPVFLLLLLALVHIYRSPERRSQLGPSVVLVLAAAAPVCLWFAWNLAAVGDLTGTADKMRELTWTVKPFAQRFNHPLFTPSGLLTFSSELTRTFWRGEFVWGLERIASPAQDLFFVASSFLFLSISMVVRPISRMLPVVENDNRPLNIAALVFASFVLVLVWLSLTFDFGTCWYPSQEHPYFTSGRLISGALIPFLLLYLSGLSSLAGRVAPGLDPLWIVLAIAVSLISVETALSLGVFDSQYNWFHLP